MSYIGQQDITDTIINDFDVEDYIIESDTELERLAKRYGVDTTDIEDNPLDADVKRYLVVYTLMRFCQDKIGTNNPEIPEADKYFIKYGIYKKEQMELKPKVTYETLTGNTTTIGENAAVSGTLYRG